MLPLFFLIATYLTFFHLQLFFPFLAIAALRLNRIRALWIAGATGLYLDLMAADHYLGFRCILFVLVMTLLHPYKRFVFEEKCLPFSLYSTFFGIFYTLALSLVQTFGPPYFVWSLEFIFIDFFFLPFCDSFVGWLLFIAPQLVLLFCRRSLKRFREKKEINR